MRSLGWGLRRAIKAMNLVPIRLPSVVLFSSTVTPTIEGLDARSIKPFARPAA